MLPNINNRGSHRGRWLLTTMTGCASDITQARTSRWPARLATALFGALLATTVSAAPADNLNVVRDLASRVGPIIGSALACPEITQSRILAATNKFSAVIKQASPSDADREALRQVFDRYVSDGRVAITTGKINCGVAERQLAGLEQSLSTPASPSASPSATSALPGIIAPA